jgi:hypothetical protein
MPKFEPFPSPGSESLRLPPLPESLRWEPPMPYRPTVEEAKELDGCPDPPLNLPDRQIVRHLVDRLMEVVNKQISRLEKEIEVLDGMIALLRKPRPTDDDKGQEQHGDGDPRKDDDDDDGAGARIARGFLERKQQTEALLGRWQTYGKRATAPYAVLLMRWMCELHLELERSRRHFERNLKLGSRRRWREILRFVRSPAVEKHLETVVRDETLPDKTWDEDEWDDLLMVMLDEMKGMIKEELWDAAWDTTEGDEEVGDEDGKGQGGDEESSGKGKDNEWLKKIVNE